MRLATWGAIAIQPGLFCGEAMVTSLPNPEVMLPNVAWDLAAPSWATWDSKEYI